MDKIPHGQYCYNPMLQQESTCPYYKKLGHGANKCELEGYVSAPDNSEEKDLFNEKCKICTHNREL